MTYQPGDRVRYVNIIGPLDSLIGGYKVRLGCCGKVAFRTEKQITRVRNNLANQCTECRIDGLRKQTIKPQRRHHG